jgi:hypothetical protein
VQSVPLDMEVRAWPLCSVSLCCGCCDGAAAACTALWPASPLFNGALGFLQAPPPLDDAAEVARRTALRSRFKTTMKTVAIRLRLTRMKEMFRVR